MKAHWILALFFVLAIGGMLVAGWWDMEQVILDNAEMHGCTAEEEEILAGFRYTEEMVDQACTIQISWRTK